MYSQNDEEKYIVEALAAETNKGRFLDIGAYDGKNLSNTYRLTELGWGGVCVEPSPTVFVGLLKNHEEHPNVSLVNCAIANQRSLVEFFDSNGDAVGTISEDHRKIWKDAVPYRPIAISTITWDNLFAFTGKDFEFMNLDVEGLNWELFETLDLTSMPKLKVICIEHDTKYEAILNKTTPLGFKEITRNGENLILKR